MLRRIFLCLAAQASLLGLAAPAFAQASSKASLESAATDLSFLLQYVMSPHQPSVDERDKVVRSLRSLKRSSHDIESSMNSRSLDPLLRYISVEARVRWAQIESIYVHGNYAHARYLLRHTVQTCVACHSASPKNTPLSFPFPRPSPVLTDFERAEYLAVLRRSKESILGFEDLLSQTSLRQNNPEIWETALQDLLALTIRVRNDPHITLELISRLTEISGHTSEQREMLLAWRQAAKAWTREPRLKRRSSDQLRMKMQQLLLQGDGTSRSHPRHGYVEYLRALNLIDEIGLNSDSARVKTMAFRIGGEIAEKLHPSYYWIYPEVYYEACIRSLPNSTESGRCWQKFEAFRSRERFTLWDREMAGALKELAR